MILPNGEIKTWPEEECKRIMNFGKLKEAGRVFPCRVAQMGEKFENGYARFTRQAVELIERFSDDLEFTKDGRITYGIKSKQLDPKGTWCNDVLYVRNTVFAKKETNDLHR